MFERLLKLTPREFKKKHVMAVDISTSAISAALALKHENTGIVEILKTLKSPFDLLGENVSEGRIPRVLRESLLKIFKDACAVSRHLDEIIVVLSDPFFLDLTFSKKINRLHPESKIGAADIARLLDDLKKETELKSGQLVLIGEETLSSKINGYDVSDAVGYSGKSMEISVVFTFINKFIKDTVLDSQEKFFPRSRLEYISDSRLMRRSLQRFRLLDEPVILFDIDGESTGLYFLSEDTVRHLGISAFGSKTLERRVSLVSRYADGALEDKLRDRVEMELQPVFLHWWEGVWPYLKQLEEIGFPKKVFVAGRDQTASVFLPNLSNYLKANVNFQQTLHFFSIEPLNDFLHPPSIISQKQDILLASLFY